ncbi:MAG TPA: hypothetical protein VFK86_06275 [Bauldia sp.]|nr:hypothetical protein [Bauldia sp.]
MPPSKPSGPPSRPSDPGNSTTSWTIPEPADVIAYAYLWADEAAAGQEEGLKDRPVVVVLARRAIGERTELLVAPITHSPPAPSEGVAVPQSVKRHLGLDDEPSWIIVTELNRFVWPGPDIRPAPGRDTPLYGAVPAKLFEQVRQAIGDHAMASRVRIPKRTE